jgi:hypothetical protein
MLKNFSLATVLVVLALLGTALAPAQTSTTGDLAGMVTDSSGAVVPNAPVTIKDVNTGEGRTVQSNANGSYRFTFLKPGEYQISSSMPGLKSDIGRITVGVSQVQNVDLILKPQEAKEVITVNDAAPLLQTDNANLASTYSTKQMELLPAPGGDITTIAFTVPGIAVSTGGGYGNFSAHGLPGTANLFVTNGNDNMDPYLNLNNSGASNLTLGANEVDQASVVQNGYTGQYGRQAGATVSFTTKSGSNDFHGTLLYTYNGSVMNANDFFNNATGTPRSRSLSNQYSASLGGRAIKDKLFFFVDTEGIRYVLPTTGVSSLPSQALQNYTLANVTAAQRPFYQQAFALYNGAPGSNRAIPVTSGDGLLQDNTPWTDDPKIPNKYPSSLGCGALAGVKTGVGNGVFGLNTSCANAYGLNLSNQNTEWLFASRVDYKINDKQNIFFRFKTDHGLQPTSTSPVNPLFNAVSSQPAYEGQVTHTWVLNSHMVNNFIGSSSYYSAIFGPANLQASLAAFPVYLLLNDGGANGTGGMDPLGVNTGSFPQGRRVGQAQVVDDFSYTHGSHALKFGVNYRYNRVTDTGLQRLTVGGRYTFVGLDEFSSGQINPASGSNYAQRFTPLLAAHIRDYEAGFYMQDEWSIARNLRITAALRFDRSANPLCVDKCFALLNQPFDTLTKGAGIPYNQSITTGNSNAFYKVEAVVPQPRVGIVYNPGWSKNTVIRGGVGLFSDTGPALVSGNIFVNAPNVFTPSVRTGSVNFGGAGSAPAIAVATGQAFQSGFANGFTLAQFQQALAPVAFTPPGYYGIPGDALNPKYLEWSFEIQQQFGAKNVFTASYVGNKGYDLFLLNAKLNGAASAAAYPNGFAGLPTTSPDPRFRIITQLTNNGISNSNGLSLEFRRAFGHGFQGRISYTWSHSLDIISNGGFLPFSGDSQASVLNPLSLKALNYSNADYDIRHNVTGDFFWELPVKFQNRAMNAVLGGWTVAGKFFARTGTPFSVINSRISGRLSPAMGGSTLATVLDANVRTSCTNVDQTCFNTSEFATLAAQNTFGNVPRNSFRAPGYFDIDSSLLKTVKLRERIKFTFGASAYNTLNHPNFSSPGFNVAAGGLGIISGTVSAPTSPYGSFQGSAVSGRVLVLTGRFTF